MADAITIQALQNASLDAKSLEEVVNGDDAKQVTTRLGETYPSVKKAIKTLFENGGLPATPFATRALMTGSALVDGDYAVVTEDSEANNGYYIKTGGSWALSKINQNIGAAQTMTHIHTTYSITANSNLVMGSSIGGSSPVADVAKMASTNVTLGKIDAGIIPVKIFFYSKNNVVAGGSGTESEVLEKKEYQWNSAVDFSKNYDVSGFSGFAMVLEIRAANNAIGKNLAVKFISNPFAEKSVVSKTIFDEPYLMPASSDRLIADGAGGLVSIADVSNMNKADFYVAPMNVGIVPIRVLLYTTARGNANSSNPVADKTILATWDTSKSFNITYDTSLHLGTAILLQFNAANAATGKTLKSRLAVSTDPYTAPAQDITSAVEYIDIEVVLNHSDLYDAGNLPKTAIKYIDISKIKNPTIFIKTDYGAALDIAAYDRRFNYSAPVQEWDGTKFVVRDGGFKASIPIGTPSNPRVFDLTKALLLDKPSMLDLRVTAKSYEDAQWSGVDKKITILIRGTK